MDVNHPEQFDAFGKPVPDKRKAQALSELRKMNPNLSTGKEMKVVGSVAEGIEHDRPYDAIQRAQEVLDLTGAYRLLAALCVDGGDQ